MAIQINAYPGGLPTGLTSIPALETLITRSGDDTIRNPAQQGFPGGGGQQVRFNGIGLTYDAQGHITGGLVTSIQLVTVDQFNNVTVNEQVAGFAIPGANFQNALNTSPLTLVQLVLAGNDTIVGSAVADNLFGHAGNDNLNGNGGDDVLTGGAGDDSYNGGAGFDTADFSDSYNNPLAVKGIQVNLGAGNINDWQGNNEATTSIERVIGTQFQDLFIGTVANETFLGLGGNDGFVGNAGIDTVDYSLDAKFGGNAGVTINLTTGVGTDGFGNTDQYSGIENLTGTEQADKITGNNGINVLRGLGGNDTIDGVAGGFDQMIGGAGDDTYIYSSNAQIVDEVQDSGAGIDEVQSSVSVDMRDATRFKGAIENLTLTGAAAVVGIGNDIANVIKGNDIANFLSGQSGDDTMSGNGGNDTMTGDGGQDKMDGGVGDDTMGGGTGNDSMTGGDGDDRMNGDDGNDRLDGGAGQNTLAGGTGDDTYVVADHGFLQDSINDTGGQHDSIETSITRDLRDYTGIEDATLSAGTAPSNLTGTTGDNILNGNDGANVLTGLGGDDTLNGGGGNDTVLGGDGNDTASGGLGDDFIFGGSGDDTLNGDAGNDSLNGGAGDDTFNGGDGNDTASGQGGSNNFSGGAGDDTFFGAGDSFDFASGGDGNDRLNGSSGNDQFHGDAGNDTLVGGLGNDSMTGDAGNDTLIGGRGIDTLTGGAGRDVFKLEYRTAGGADRDIIRDFSHADDTIQLSRAVFGALGSGAGGTGTLKAQFFFAGTKAHDGNDHIIYNKANGAIYYDSDGNSGGSHSHAQVLIGVLSNHPANVAFNDFVIV